MTQPLALLIDDEPDICHLLEITLARMNISSYSAFFRRGTSVLKQKHLIFA